MPHAGRAISTLSAGGWPFAACSQAGGSPGGPASGLQPRRRGHILWGLPGNHIFSSPAGASEPHRALKWSFPLTEGPWELKRGPGLGAREGQAPEEPSTVGY